MLYLSITESEIEALQTSKNIFGKETITAVSKKELPKGIILEGQIANYEKLVPVFHELLAQSYPKPITDKKVSVIIPDNSYSTQRFSLKEKGGDMAGQVIEEAKKDIPFKIVDMENYYQILESDGSTANIFYTAMAKKTILNYDGFFKSLGFELKFLSYLSLSQFNLISHLIGVGEKVLYVEVEKETITLYLYDMFGLLNYIKRKVSTTLSGTISQMVKNVAIEKNIAINKLIIAGSNSMEVHTQDLNGLKDIIIIKIGELVEEILKSHKIQIDTGGVSKILFVNSLSVLFFSNSIEPANFASDLKSLVGTSYANNENLLPMNLPVIEGKKEWNKFLLPVVAAISGFFLVMAFYYFMINKKNINFPILSYPTSTPFPTVVPSFTPTPTIDPSLKRSDIKISVQNGTDKTGYAKDIASYLEGKGYKNIDKSNADRSDYDKTVIKIKDSRKNYLYLLINDLQDKVDTSTTATLDPDNNFDAVLVLGKK